MLLTILTPTYNRAHTLNRLYESLVRQNCKNFQWLVVDDGSTDDTKEYINNLKLSNPDFNVIYIFQENGGKHTAINRGMEIVDTKLVFIVDSDDYLTDDAVKIIVEKWNEYKEIRDISSFWFLQKDESGNTIGSEFLLSEQVSSYTSVMINSNIVGDKKAVYLTDIRKKFPFPVFGNEKFLGEGLIHKRIGDRYKSVFINKCIYISEYLPDGLTSSGLAMRIKNPFGGMELSKEFLTKDVNVKTRIKKRLLYLVYGLLSNQNPMVFIKNTNNFIANIMLLPVAFMIYKKWKYRSNA